MKVMRGLVPLLVMLLAVADAWGSNDCQAILQQLHLPHRVKTRDKPRVARWEQVDEIVNDLRQTAQNAHCRFSFETLFKTRRKEMFFPLTNSLLSIVPEESLKGLTVFRHDGTELGSFVGKVLYERSGNLYATKSYHLYFFQYRDRQGKLQTSGTQLLLDRFTVKWADVAAKTAFASPQ